MTLDDGRKDERRRATEDPRRAPWRQGWEAHAPSVARADRIIVELPLGGVRFCGRLAIGSRRVIAGRAEILICVI